MDRPGATRLGWLDTPARVRRPVERKSMKHLTRWVDRLTARVTDDAKTQTSDEIEPGGGSDRETALDSGPSLRVRKKARDVLNGYRGVTETVHGWTGPLSSHVPKEPAKPSGERRLRAMTYNVFLGGKDYPALLETVAAADPDVLALQEISRHNAHRLAKDLGMHMVYYSRGMTPLAVTGGKAILSKHPIEHAEHKTFDPSPAEHLKAIQRFRKGKEPTLFGMGELASRRGVLEARIRTGDKTIVLLDAHLTLTDPKINAAQLRELEERSARYTSEGWEVVLMADFNTNLALGDDRAPGEPIQADETDTIGEFQARYGSDAGNIADEDNYAAAQALRRRLSSAWESGDDRFSLTERNGQMTPDEARALLGSGEIEPGTKAWELVSAAADGITHPELNMRLDQVMVSRGLKVERAVIDQASEASDHKPVIADLEW